MNGYPKVIATRQDVENLLAMPEYRDRTVAQLQALLDERYGWLFGGRLADGEAGDTTSGHMVAEAQDATGDIVERYQYAWGLLPQTGLARLGVTAEEAVAWGCEDRVIAPPEK